MENKKETETKEIMDVEKIREPFRQPNFIGRLKGKPVTIHLLDGTKIKGVVKGFNSYEIYLNDISSPCCSLGEVNEDDVLVFKHAVSYIESPDLGKAKTAGEHKT
jgi:sRNA-binding regulator protein Hfq